MATYTNHPDGLFDPGDPILGSVALQTRDNLIATAKGADGAPRVVSRALNMSFMQSSSHGSVVAETTFDSIDLGTSGYDSVLVWGYGEITTAGDPVAGFGIYLQGSNNGSSYTSLATLSGPWTFISGADPGATYIAGSWDGSAATTAYRYYRIRGAGDSDARLSRYHITALFISGDTT